MPRAARRERRPRTGVREGAGGRRGRGREHDFTVKLPGHFTFHFTCEFTVKCERCEIKFQKLAIFSCARYDVHLARVLFRDDA